MVKCSRCGNRDAEKGFLQCLYCLSVKRKRAARLMRERLEKNLCTTCGKAVAVNGFRACVGCKVNEAIAYRRRLELRQQSGRCIKCCKPIDECRIAAKRCISCCLKEVCRLNLGSYKDFKAIELLFYEQGCCCAYTGVSLVIGVNASLDHKQPRSKGGTNDLSNLQWVDYNINLMKQGMADEEFRSYLAGVFQSYSNVCQQQKERLV